MRLNVRIRLDARGHAVAVLHPGMVDTDMIHGHGQFEPEDSARGLLARIDALTLESSGGFLASERRGAALVRRGAGAGDLDRVAPRSVALFPRERRAVTILGGAASCS